MRHCARRFILRCWRSLPFSCLRPHYSLPLLACLLGAVAPALAQGLYLFPGSAPVTAPLLPQTATVTLTVQTGGTVAAVQVLTDGSPNLDYTQGAGSGCAVGMTYSASQTCSVSVIFQPLYPGKRHGAVVLTASDGTVLATEYLEGTGTGALNVLIPGVINTVAGDVDWIYSGDNGPATNSAIFLPMGEVTDGAGNLYIADTNNNRIRRVDAVSKTITTVAGGYSQGYSGDNGPGVNALLNGPTALAIDGAGNLYIADSGNYVIRRLNTLSGTITTIAGTGGQTGDTNDGQQATTAQLSAVNGLALDAQEHLYLSDTGNNVIRVIDLTTGIITRYAGTGTAGYADGAAASASFNSPQGLTVATDGSLYVADLKNNLVRKIDPSHTVSTVAGGGTSGLGDDGPPTQAQLDLPAAVAIDQAGNLYIADAGNNRIRKVSVSTGKITTLSGTGNEAFAGDGGTADQAELYGPYSLFYDGQGDLFIGDMFHNRIREISGSVTALKFDPIRVNRVSPPQVVNVENDGNDDLKLQAPGLLNAELDSSTTTCASVQTLTTGNSCALGVSFAPTVLGDNVAGSVSLVSNTAGANAIINVSGQSLSVDPTAVALSSSQNPSPLGGAVTFTAKVTTQGTSLTGSVQFFDGTTPLGGGQLNAADIVTVTVSNLALGQHAITAAYSGDSTNASSTSPVLTQSVKQSTALMLNSTPNPSIQGGAVVLTAQISGATTPTGQITFLSDGATLGTGALNGSGMATLTVSSLTIGTHRLTATYEGDTNNSGSQSNTIQQTVQGQPSGTMLATSNANLPVGSSVTFTAQVTGNGTIVPTGSITFKDGGSTIGTTTLNGGAAASFSISSLSAGSHTIVAVYSGDSTYASSTSAPVVETMAQIGTSTAVSSSTNPAPAGAAITLNAAVQASVANPTGGPISGTVTFMNGGTALGTVTLNANGLASLPVSTLPLGQDNITAIYKGNANYIASTSAPITITVQQAMSSTALATSASPSTVEDPITLTATVTTNGGKATGIVTFSSDGAVLGTGTLNAQGVATFSTTSLMVGQHALVASYAGDANDLPSVSAAVPETITLHPSATVLTSSATSLDGGQQVTLIAVVQWTGGIVPTGSVTFQSAGTALGSSAIDGTGVAALTINPQTGLTTITATYSGDGVFAGSTSAPVSVTVGAPPQFVMQPSTTQIALQSSQHTNIDLTISSEKGFADTLTLGCAGLPQAATCTFSADQMTLAANGSSTVHIVVDTGSPLTAGSVAKNEVPRAPMIAVCGLPLGMCFSLLFWKGRRRALGGLMLALCALGMMAGLTGCGALNINSTPPGTYQFQITAAAKGAGVVQAVNMTLKVSQ